MVEDEDVAMVTAAWRGRGRVGARRLGRGESLASRAPRGVGSVEASMQPAVVGVLGRRGGDGGEGGGAGWREQSGGCAWGEGRRLAARLL